MNLKLSLTLGTALALAVAASFTAFAAEENRNAVQLQYQYAGTAFQSVRNTFGSVAAKAITSIDPHQNTVILNPAHPDADKIRAFLTAHDLRPALAEVSATITETVQTPGRPMGKTEVLAQPKVTGNYGEPMTISVGDSARTLTIELVVKHIRGENPGDK
jgi:hypothetical protein